MENKIAELDKQMINTQETCRHTCSLKDTEFEEKLSEQKEKARGIIRKNLALQKEKKDLSDNIQLCQLHIGHFIRDVYLQHDPDVKSRISGLSEFFPGVDENFTNLSFDITDPWTCLAFIFVVLAFVQGNSGSQTRAKFQRMLDSDEQMSTEIHLV